MNFFEITSRQDFAGYVADDVSGEIDERRIIPPYRKITPTISEYFFGTRRRPGKRGDIHKTAHGAFLTSKGLDLFEEASRGRLLKSTATLVGRADEVSFQVWVVNFVDCLDVAKTVASPPGGFYSGKLGVIKRPVFDESRWDGSDLFVVPQDVNYCLFCTEKFLRTWKHVGLKGALFSRFLMDHDAIKA